MKQNRLIRPSNQVNIFSNKARKFGKTRNLLVLSVLAFAGISITSMVLATNKPIVNATKSQLIDLPNLLAENQNISNNTPQYSATSTMSVAKQQLGSTSSFTRLSELAIEETSDSAPIDEEQIANAAHEAELALLEQQEILAALDDVEVETINTAKSTIDWQEITVKSGDNLSLIFPRVGLSARDVYNVAQLGKEVKPLLNLKPGQILRFSIKSAEETKTLDKLELELSALQTLSITSSDNGYQTSMETRVVDSRQTQASGQIENSLFEAGIEAGLSDNIIMELAYIFGWDIDFALDLRKNDSFTIIYSEEYLDGEKIADGDILAAEFTNRGKTYRAVRYTDKTDVTRYYAPNGDSMRKTFSRSPVHFSRISSRFNPNRKHPILKTSRPHKGVDYAAARGTPITATGDGKVSSVGRKGGYGRTVVLSHGGKYTTLYAHMSSYKKGLRAGKRVQQGDVIGYIGSSGLATGPHLHYEFRVNGVHRNPLTVSLPKAEPLEKKYIADFKQKSESLLAQLDRISDTKLALNDN
ncbi:MAG: peptidoglycan DD-metalloendopeptidase family protein [Methylophaga sp.]|nr:peptidoglycan DD-metalloendopeptidase family protein [Methylophaga sp.]